MDFELEAQKIRSELEKFTLPFIKLVPKTEKPKNIWSSMFGGKPYWPKDMEYPESSSGEKLILLAQLNFNELPSLAELLQSGRLQLFIEEDDLYGTDFDTPIDELMEAPSSYRVIYHPFVDSNKELLDDIPEVNGESELPISREYRLESTLDSEIPSPTDYRYEKYAGDPFEYEEELGEYVYDNFLAEGSKIGGYANFTQEDPRIDEEGDSWVLLFQMDSESVGDNEIMWAMWA